MITGRDLKRLKKELKELDTQQAREQAIERLTELAEICHEQGVAPTRKLKTSREWFRLEAYVYQTINTILREYDERLIKARLDEIWQRLETLEDKREEAAEK